jgi:UDP-2,4-diacetamido-2,4,6-trideoxy-beta-L-altropyranose hydrolase
MRRSFVLHRDTALAQHDGRPVREILVSCGATDPANATAVALDALADVVDDVVVTVVLSSRAPHVDAVRKHLQGKARLLLDAEDMAGLMTNADLAIGAPGSTSYERAVLGLPSILVTLADNQRCIARLMIDAGAAIDAGMLDEGFASRLRRLVAAHLADGAARQRLSQAASELVDGRGKVRVAVAMLDDETTKDGVRIRLRLAEPADESWLLQLQQYPQTRRYFCNVAIPGAEEHHDWMQQTLADPKRLLLIIEVDGVSVGSVRLDRLSDQGSAAHHEVAIAIDPGRHGRGFGSAALRLVRALMPGAVLDATILPENKPSQALFEKAGFVALSGDLYRNGPHQVGRI